MKNVKNSSLKKLLPLLKKQSLLLIVLLVSTLITVISALYIPLLCGRFIDTLESVSGTAYQQGVILIKISICTFLSSVFSYLSSVTGNTIVFRITGELRKQCFDTVSRLPLSYIDTAPHGDIVSRIISDVDNVADGLIMGATHLLSGILTILITLYFMLKTYTSLAVVVIILTPLSVFFSSFIAKKTYTMFSKQSEIRGDMTSFINERISEQLTVRIYSQEEKTLSEFENLTEDYGKATLKAVFYSSLVNPATRFVNNVVYAVICLFGALHAADGFITVGVLTSFLAYSTQYTKPFNEISGVIAELQNAIACNTRIFELIETEWENDCDGTLTLDGNMNGNIVFDGVEFSYVPEKKILDSISFSASHGETVALVGKTGCGKTTVINLLMRYYDQQKGCVYIDGNDIARKKRASVRSNIGMVLQDTWIMSGTVRDNILMGRSASDDEVITAAKLSHAHDFIKKLKNGYDTYITNDNCILSEGQRQLLAITRVMLRIPPVLILDEATSSIDTRTELQIQDAFSELTRNRTSLIVAHRLSTVRNADTILYVKDGKVAEKGKHEELLERKGLYYSMWNSQFDSPRT